MVIPAEGKIRSHVVFSSEVRGGRVRIFFKKIRDGINGDVAEI